MYKSFRACRLKASHHILLTLALAAFELTEQLD